jgi:hypothetical protein
MVLGLVKIIDKRKKRHGTKEWKVRCDVQEE